MIVGYKIGMRGWLIGLGSLGLGKSRFFGQSLGFSLGLGLGWKAQKQTETFAKNITIFGPKIMNFQQKFFWGWQFFFLFIYLWWFFWCSRQKLMEYRHILALKFFDLKFGSNMTYFEYFFKVLVSVYKVSVSVGPVSVLVSVSVFLATFPALPQKLFC